MPDDSMIEVAVRLAKALVPFAGLILPGLPREQIQVYINVADVEVAREALSATGSRDS